MRHCAMGRHARYRKPPSPRSYLIALLAAVAALCGAVAFAVQPSAAARLSPGALNAQDAAIAVQAREAALAAGMRVDKASLARDSRAATAALEARSAALLASAVYTVRPGDTLSSVATARCGTARDWTGIYAASRQRGWTAWNADDLTAGQHLFLYCAYEPGMLDRAAAAGRQATAVTAASPAAAVTAVSYSGSGSMQQCIIARESGGNSQAWNASGHYGLYQFSASTWAAHGGNPADFGHASVAEQNQVYYSTVAQDGYSDWAPYDGC